MENKLVRYQHSGHFHLVNFSCYHRRPYFSSRSNCELFERSLEKMRVRYGMMIFGYVVMPDHVHLLVTEPKISVLAKAVQAIKLSVSVQQNKQPFWQARYYDFNVFTHKKFVEKLRYIHRNPVASRVVPRTGSRFLNHS
jgi:putative transposase